MTSCYQHTGTNTFQTSNKKNLCLKHPIKGCLVGSGFDCDRGELGLSLSLITIADTELYSPPLRQLQNDALGKIHAYTLSINIDS